MTGLPPNRTGHHRPFTTTRLSRPLAAPAVLGTASLLAGCMYDPFSGTYALCCSTPCHGYPAFVPYYGGSPYVYPPYYSPAVYPPQPGYAEQQDATSGNDTALAQRFARAKTTHDGWLTQRQAETAN